jgi:hypothetical protein
MRHALAVAVALVIACGGKQTKTTTTDPPPPVDHRTAIEKRRDAACEQLEPRLTECAIADLKKSVTPKQLAELDLDKMRAKHKQDFVKKCEGSSMSSRQVRVLEVCFKSETECDPLGECLANLQPKQ